MLPGPTIAAVTFWVMVLLLEGDGQGLEPADGRRDAVTRGERHEGPEGPGQDQVSRAERVAEACGLDGEPAQRLQRVAEAGRAVAGRAHLVVDGQAHLDVARLDVAQREPRVTHDVQ